MTMNRGRWLYPIAALIALLAAPVIIQDTYWLHLMIMWGIFSIVTLSLNIAVGLAGQLSFGHAGFWGIGAYTSALLVLNGISWPLAFLLAGLMTGAIGMAISLPFLRLKGLYLGMATFGFGEIVHLVLRNWEGLTGGSLGLAAIPPPAMLGFEVIEQQDYFYLVMLVLVGVLAFSIRLVNTAPGLAMQALRDDELAAQASAINVTSYRVGAMGTSSMIAGLSGSLFAHYITYLSPENFTVVESILIVAMLIVGGRGNVLGSLAGAALLTILPEVFRIVPEVRILLYGTMLVAISIVRPQGILGGLRWGQAPPGGVSNLV